MDHTELRDVIGKLKDRIIKIEAGPTELSETDTRQGLINPLFRALGWDFSDFDSIKSEVRIPNFNEPVDYAFYSSTKQTGLPVLLLEAKKLGTNLAHKNHIKQLTAYLGGMGVQWGVLSDGNRYILYNSRGGVSFEDQKFLALELKTIDTDSGFTQDDFVKHLSTLLSRECLENEEIQQAYEDHMINSQVRVALDSLLTKPFDTLVSAIRREFKEERVGLPMGIRISKKHIDSFLESISDESGRIPVDLEAEAIHAETVVEDNVLEGRSDKTHKVKSYGKRVTIGDLLREEVVREGDQWRLTFKGEVIWGRIEANGQIEVNSEGYGNPSKALEAATSKAGNGWYYWQYSTEAGDWKSVGELRNVYREKMARKSTLSIVQGGEGAA